MDNKIFGNIGEEKAVAFLKSKGYQILETNYSQRSGEIDIIAYDPAHREYVFIEVKSRKNSQFGYPEEFVDDLKLDKISSVASVWLQKNVDDNVDWRIDIIALTHYQNTFQIKHLENI